MAKRLIVNADELGLTEAVNSAIADAFKRGIVTSASVIVNMWAFDDGVHVARELNLPVGVHMNLTDGCPVLPRDQVPSLVDGGGRFWRRPVFFLRATLGLIRRREIEAEVCAQVERARSAGLRLTHLDSHQHSYIHPLVFGVALDIAKRHQLAIRSPRERLLLDVTWPLRLARPMFLKKLVRFVWGSVLLIAARRRRVPTTDHMLSITGYFGRTAAMSDVYRAILASVGEGTTEFMTHPGYFDPRLVGFLWDAEVGARRREDEAQALCDPMVRGEVDRQGIELTSFETLRRPRRVLHVMSSGTVGGIENHVCAVMAGVNGERYRHEVAFFAGQVDQAASIAGPARAAGAAVHDLGFRGRLDWRGLWRLWRLLRGLDVVNVHSPFAEAVVLPSVWFSRVRVVSTVHNMYPLYESRVGRALWRLLYRRVDKIIAISQAVADHLQQVLDQAAEKIQVIHYGFRPDRVVVHGPLDPALAAGRPLLLNVARLAEQKGQRYLIEAMVRIVCGHPAATLLFVGHDTEGLGGELADLARRLGVEQHVRFTGFRDDIATLMRAADIFVLPSLYEGFGLVLLEAMASGLPVVATSVGPIPEVIEHGRSGLLVAPRDPEALATAILRVLGDPELRASFSSAGLARLGALFVEERMCREYAQVYEEGA